MKPADLRDHLVEQGRYFASSDDLCDLLDVRPESLYGSLHRPSERGEITNVCPGGWVPTPVGYQAAGPWLLPPLTWYVDDMMRHLGHDYYLGHSTAAERWGASHHRSSYETLVTTARTTHRTAEDSRCPEPGPAPLPLAKYIYSSSIGSKETDTLVGDGESWLPAGVSVVYSSPEVTLLDMVQRARTGTAVDNACNTACLMLFWGHLDAEKLTEQSFAYPLPTRQRTGRIVDAASEHMGVPFDSGLLSASLPTSLEPVSLFPGCDHWFPPLHDIPGRFEVLFPWQIEQNGLLAPDV